MLAPKIFLSLLALILTTFLTASCALLIGTQVSTTSKHTTNETNFSKLVVGIAAFAVTDYKSAFINLRPLGRQGDPQAQLYLGRMYQEGLGIEEDDTKAKFWFAKAAEQGLSEAQFNLALMYAKGEGVPQDMVTALKWLDLSLASSEPASIDFYEARNLRDKIASQLTPAQIAEAQKLASEWKKKQTP